MDSFGIGGVAGLGAASAGLVWVTVRRVRRRLAARREAKAPGRAPAGRLEALAAAQADLAARVEALAAQGAAPEERMQALAAQLLGVIRDKNATMETALAGLDQLRARMRALEQMGEPAEARALLERLEARLDELAAAQAAGVAGLEARIGGIESPDAAAALAERLAALHEKRDAGIEAVIGRLGPLETRLAGLEGERAALPALREALKRVEARLEAQAGEQGSARAELAGLKAQADGGGTRALSERLARLQEQKEALAETVLARLAALEAGAAPLVEVAGQLTRLYAQKDAAVEAVFTRLAPLEARLAELETGLAGRDPAPALERLAERLAALEGGGPFAEISEQLTRLYAQKDAAVEAVFTRLAPLEARLAELETGLAGRDPAPALERLGERLAALEDGSPFAEISERLARLHAQRDAAVDTVLARLAPVEAKLAALEAGLEAAAGENPFADISGQLTRLYAQKDAAVEAVFTRLAPLEARLAELEARLAGESPFAEVSEQLTRLYAQRDAAVDTVLARLAPVEAKLAELDAGLAGRDPAPALERLAERLATLEEPGENPFAEVSERLTRLYAQKDAAVDTVLARLAPLEAKLAELEGGLGRIGPLEAKLAAADPAPALDGLAARLEAVAWAQGELAAGLAALKAAGEDAGPLDRVADELTRLHAQRDAGVEARLAALEVRPWDPDAEEARAEARAIAAQIAAAHAAAEQTAALADRLARLEASLPRPPAPEPALTAEGIEAIWTLPRVVSLHRK